MSSDSPEKRAIATLIDIVEELAQGLAHGQTPDAAWADVVSETLRGIRVELGVEAR